MASRSIYEVDDETINILKQGKVKDNVYYLPNKQLEKVVYEKVDKVLKALGAKWNKSLKGHTFEYEISEELEEVYKNKKVTDWKKNTDFFYTPFEVINEMIGFLPVYYCEELNFLEPSCGQGHIVDEISRLFVNSKITCIEKNKRHCEFMKKKGYNPICADFLDIEPEPKYDVILMNPPFKEEREHIRHAHKFLKEDGKLVSVAKGHILNDISKKGQEFKKWFEEVNGYCYTLHKNSFRESGTDVNTVLLIFEKEEDLINVI